MKLPTVRVCICAAVPLAGGPLVAQVNGPVRLSLSGGVDAAYSVRSTRPQGSIAMRGIGASGTGQLALGPLRLRASYGEVFFDAGGVEPTPAAVELVEAEALVGIAPVRWLSLWVGPHVRTYAGPRGDTRWLLWEAHAYTRVPLVPNWLDCYFEGWEAVAGQALTPEPLASGRGARGGVAFRLFDPSVWVNLSYRAEHVRFGDEARHETVEVLTVRLEGRP